MEAPGSRPQPRDDFVSGTSGGVWGIRATTRALIRDLAHDGLALAGLRPARLRRAAGGWPTRRILAIGLEREGEANLLSPAFDELRRSHHEVEVAHTAVGGRGKWENVDELLGAHPAGGHDWLLVIDDDVRLPGGFLDAFVFLAERFGLRIAQPAHRARSHAAWGVTRRQAGSVARRTAFVESGPVVGFHASTFEVLLPFPRLRTGWGLDVHWSALAREREWPVGVLDAVAVGHGLRRIAAAYDRSEAMAEAREFLAGRPYLPAAEANRTLARYAGWT